MIRPFFYPSLRAKRSNPYRGMPDLDCRRFDPIALTFALLLAMTSRYAAACFFGGNLP